MMAEANRAYEEGDEARLREILHEWVISPETVEGEGVAAELVRTIRKIAQVKKRLKVIESEIAAMMASELYDLHIKAEKTALEGRNLLEEMATQVERKIKRARERLTEVRKRAPSL